MPQHKVGIYEHKRNWVKYNEKLVRRSEFYLDLDFINNWDKKLAIQNKGKFGRPFDYPNSFMKFSALAHVFRLPYRQLEGFFRRLSKFVPILKAADYTTMFKRIASIDIRMCSAFYSFAHFFVRV